MISKVLCIMNAEIEIHTAVERVLKDVIDIVIKMEESDLNSGMECEGNEDSTKKHCLGIPQNEELVKEIVQDILEASLCQISGESLSDQMSERDCNIEFIKEEMNNSFQTTKDPTKHVSFASPLLIYQEYNVNVGNGTDSTCSTQELPQDVMENDNMKNNLDNTCIHIADDSDKIDRCDQTKESICKSEGENVNMKDGLNSERTIDQIVKEDLKANIEDKLNPAGTFHTIVNDDLIEKINVDRDRYAVFHCTEWVDQSISASKTVEDVKEMEIQKTVKWEARSDNFSKNLDLKLTNGIEKQEVECDKVLLFADHDSPTSIIYKVPMLEELCQQILETKEFCVKEGLNQIKDVAEIAENNHALCHKVALDERLGTDLIPTIKQVEYIEKENLDSKVNAISKIESAYLTEETEISHIYIINHVGENEDDALHVQNFEKIYEQELRNEYLLSDPIKQNGLESITCDDDNNSDRIKFGTVDIKMKKYTHVVANPTIHSDSIDTIYRCDEKVKSMDIDVHDSNKVEEKSEVEFKHEECHEIVKDIDSKEVELKHKEPYEIENSIDAKKINHSPMMLKEICELLLQTNMHFILSNGNVSLSNGVVDQRNEDLVDDDVPGKECGQDLEIEKICSSNSNIVNSIEKSNEPCSEKKEDKIPKIIENKVDINMINVCVIEPVQCHDSQVNNCTVTVTEIKSGNDLCITPLQDFTCENDEKSHNTVNNELKMNAGDNPDNQNCNQCLLLPEGDSSYGKVPDNHLKQSILQSIVMNNEVNFPEIGIDDNNDKCINGQDRDIEHLIHIGTDCHNNPARKYDSVDEYCKITLSESQDETLEFITASQLYMSQSQSQGSQEKEPQDDVENFLVKGEEIDHCEEEATLKRKAGVVAGYEESSPKKQKLEITKNMLADEQMVPDVEMTCKPEFDDHILPAEEALEGTESTREIMYACDVDLYNNEGEALCQSLDNFSQTRSQTRLSQTEYKENNETAIEPLISHQHLHPGISFKWKSKISPDYTYSDGVVPEMLQPVSNENFDPGLTIFSPPPSCERVRRLGLSRRQRVKKVLHPYFKKPES